MFESKNSQSVFIWVPKEGKFEEVHMRKYSIDGPHDNTLNKRFFDFTSSSTTIRSSNLLDDQKKAPHFNNGCFCRNCCTNESDNLFWSLTEFEVGISVDRVVNSKILC